MRKVKIGVINLLWFGYFWVLRILQNVKGQTGTRTAFWPAWTRLTGALDGPCQSELIWLGLNGWLSTLWVMTIRLSNSLKGSWVTRLWLFIWHTDINTSPGATFIIFYHRHTQRQVSLDAGVLCKFINIQISPKVLETFTIILFYLHIKRVSFDC